MGLSGLNVVIASPEAEPFAKTGGLADVAGSLPLALKNLGCKVVLVLPYYRQVTLKEIKAGPTGLEITVPIGKRKITGQVLQAHLDGVPVYFIRRDEFFDRTYIYGTPEGDYFDNLERYAFFSRGVLELLKAGGFGGFAPDVIHCNDWQTGLIPAYLRDTYKNDPFFSKVATVFTIHNIAYQGLFPGNLFDVTHLSPAIFNPDALEFWGQINLLKGGLAYADILTTVSRQYSKEIQTPEYGAGLEGFLKRRKADLYGVLNGVDYEEWDPEKDQRIPENYSADDLKGKLACKRKLLKEFGLKLKPDTPLIGMISRLAAQKGFDILSEAMPELMKLDIGIVILGSGEKRYKDLIEGLASLYPNRLSVKIAFNNGISHLVEAGSDMFLMPSRYEPCGLNQMYSLKYGTIPIVRATGGLEDTVRDYKDNEGTGFKFKEYSASALVEKVKEALAVYKDKKAWAELQRRAMAGNFSWEESAKRYLELYRLAIKNCLKVEQQSTKNTQVKSPK